MSKFNLEKFRNEFLKSDGWQVSDCYKVYKDEFLRKDAQDAYEGAKWAWEEQQKVIDELQGRIDKALEKAGNAHIGYQMLYHQFGQVCDILRGKNEV